MADGKLVEHASPVSAFKASDGSLHLTQEAAQARSWHVAGCHALELFCESEFTSTRNDRDEIHRSLLKNAAVLATMLKDIANGQEAGKDAS